MHSPTSALLHLDFRIVDLAKDPTGKRSFSKIDYVLRLWTLILSCHKALVSI